MATDDREKLVTASKALIDGLSDWTDQISSFRWDVKQGYLEIVMRAILRRQFECLTVAVRLVEDKVGFAAVPLLRPACEELIWARYLNQLRLEDARELIDCLIGSGLSRDLEAQAGEVGDKAMAELGLAAVLDGFRARKPSLQLQLRDLGQRLAWPERTVKKAEIPSTSFVARASGSQDLYRFIYHATSRYVHFSPVELARRGWGNAERLQISSETYEPVWGLFSLSWGSRLLGMTIQASLEAAHQTALPEPDFAVLRSVFESIAEVPLIPLVTAEETIWK
jgi:Family of unknown function (DUF5677)